MEQPQLNWITNFIWGIADDVLRDLKHRPTQQQLRGLPGRLLTQRAGDP